ncbi:MAG: hypothetical protein CL878_11405 [Dehalococcoidia bacterium]|nr:hypothetical protein [Dehalococcoidia bacterium]
MRFLWGPVPTTIAPPREIAGHEVWSFGAQPGEYTDEDDADTWESLIRRVGPDVLPDVIIWWQPEYFPFPGQGAAAAPVPLVALVTDWNLALSALAGALRVCDYIFTDRAGVEAFERAGYRNVAFCPFWSFVPELHRLIPGLERTYDITFVGNLNHSIQRERAAWLRRLALLGRSRRVLIGEGIYDEDYARLLNQSKIVFNRSIRGELNIRAYEATACGALLFMEDGNAEIGDVFRDGNDCVLYDEENLETLIDRYLDDAEGRERIARSGQRRVQMASYIARQEHLLGLIAGLWPGWKGTSRGDKSSWLRVEDAEQCYWRGRHLDLGLLSNHVVEAVRHFASAVDLDGDDPEYLSALGATRAKLAMAFPEDSEEHTGGLREAERTLAMVIERWPDYALARYSLAKLHMDSGAVEAAAPQLGRLLLLLGKSAPTALPRSGVYYPRAYNTFTVEWEMATAKARGPAGTANEEHARLLSWTGWSDLGSIYVKLGLHRPGLQAYSDAIAARPDLGDPYAARAEVRERVGDAEGAAADFKAAMERKPFHFGAWRGLARCLSGLGRTAELRSFREDCLTIIDACPNYAHLRPEFMAIGQ